MDIENTNHWYDEKDLIAMSSKGDLDAFNDLVLRYQNMAYNHAFALLGDSALSEDAMQESFIKAFQAMNSFRGGSFRGWLLKIVTNSSYDLIRRSRRSTTQPLFPEDENGDVVESAVWLADPKASVQETVEHGEFSREIYKLLDELSENYRTVITLIDVHELDYAEAAQALKVPIGTVKSRLARARLQMQEKIRGRMDVGSRLAGSDRSLAV